MTIVIIMLQSSAEIKYLTLKLKLKLNRRDIKMTQATVTGRLVTNPAKFFDGATDAYGKHKFTALIVLDEKSLILIEKAKAEALSDTFEGKIPKTLQDWVLREGDDEEYMSTFGHKFINASSAKAIKAIKKHNGEVIEVSADDGVFYSGCDVAVSVDIYAYSGDKKKGIKPGVTVGLRAVMFLQDNEPLGNSVNASSEFADFDSEIDEDDEF